MQLLVQTDGGVYCLYDETLDLSVFGRRSIQRVSYVEPTDHGAWQADLSPVDGPVLGPFSLRSTALEAERSWLESHVFV
jgi:hypothetical protein